MRATAITWATSAILHTRRVHGAAEGKGDRIPPLLAVRPLHSCACPRGQFTAPGRMSRLTQHVPQVYRRPCVKA
ncbi:MAG: hypothetical protein KatS3mg059_0402 [Thermomicrobiales bacterium]|nr:MAG: hypothetical protein KatS3mg059_0402 [Thermomicrobiales bacterium]